MKSHNTRLGARHIVSRMNEKSVRFGMLLTAIFFIAPAIRLLLLSAECGSSGNTFWAGLLSAPVSGLVVDGPNIYATSGTTLSVRRNSSVPTNYWIRDFGTINPGQPVTFAKSDDSGSLVVCGSSDGTVYALDTGNGTTNWSRVTRRSGCASDSISALPVTQLRGLSDSNFQAAISSDVIIVGTKFGCASTTANRVLGLSANNGAILWVHNSGGTYEYDRFVGFAVDYTHNRVYATASREQAVSQSTVVALSTTNGARLWGRDLGPIEAAPVVANGGLIVASSAGALHKLDLATGASIWSVTNAGAGSITRIPVADQAASVIYLTDDVGRLTAFIDYCDEVAALWSTDLAGAKVTSTAALLSSARKIYVGAGDGRVYQLNALTGATESYSVVSDVGAETTFVTVTKDDNSGSPRLVAAAGQRLHYVCVPWLADGEPKTTAESRQLKDEPVCSDPNAPDSGLLLNAVPLVSTSHPGEMISRQLVLYNSTCYPFRCMAVHGAIPLGLGLHTVTCSNATVTTDSQSFLVQPWGALPVQVTLVITSSVPGIHVITAAVFNASSPHVILRITNIVTLPRLEIERRSDSIVLKWPALEGWFLARANDLPAPAWTIVNENFTTNNGFRTYSLTNDLPSAATMFYQLKQ